MFIEKNFTRFARSYSLFALARYGMMLYFFHAKSRVFFLQFFMTIIESLFIDNNYTRFARSSFFSLVRYDIMLHCFILNQMVL